jgi:hypothetical protein
MEFGGEEDACTCVFKEEEKMGEAEDAPRGRAPRRNVRLAADACRDDDNGERVLRSGAADADAARLRCAWAGKGVGSDGGNEVRDEERKDRGRRGRVWEGKGSCKQALVSLR